MTPPTQSRPDAVRERIVDEFTVRARTVGPDSVVMAELARDLGISTRTLYKQFESKKVLVTEVLRRFAEEWSSGHEDLLRQGLTPVERIRIGALAWVETQTHFSGAFWSDIRRRYPEAMEVWQKGIAPVWSSAARHAIPDLRDDLPPGLAFSLLLHGIRSAANPDRCNRLGISREDAVVHAVDIWARGALKRPNLSVVPAAED